MKARHLIIPAALLFVFACSKVQQQAFHQTIHPPFENLEPEPGVYTFDASESYTFTTETGSQISIPANAFVGKDGEPITGEVSVEFTEYHSISDIMLSGIPMTIKSESGEIEYFQSAGMFNIDGKQGDAEIEIAEGKTIDVALSSSAEDADYSFYSFNEEAGNWVTEAEPVAPQPNPIRIEAESNMPEEPVRPVEVKKASSSDQVFELAIDTRLNPEFEEIQSVLWASADKDFTFQPTDQILEPSLTCIDAETSTYNLTGTSGGKDIDMKVKPVLFGSKYDKAKASFDKKMNSYKEKREEFENQARRVEKMNKLVRRAKISSFGVFNFDRFYHMKDKISFNPLFVIPAAAKVMKDAFIIIRKDKTIIPWRPNTGYMFTISPSTPVTIVTMGDNGELYEFTEKDFNKLPFDDIETYGEHSFKMKPTGIKITNSADLDKYLNQH